MKINKKLIDYTKVLYDNATNATAGEITLSEDASNYEYLEILARTNQDNALYTKVAPTGNFALQVLEGSTLDNYFANMKCTSFAVNVNKITPNISREVNIKGSAKTINAVAESQTIFITKVIGVR